MTSLRWQKRSSEFRFDYWHTEAEHYFYVVRQGADQYTGKWAILDGIKVWNGEFWDPNARGHDMFRYDRDEALEVAEKLAFEENQKIVARQERRFPGEFRGGPYDMAAQAVTT